MIAPSLPAPAPTVAAFTAPSAFSPDRVLASGPSAAWFDLARRAAPVCGPLARPALVTAFIEHG